MKGLNIKSIIIFTFCGIVTILLGSYLLQVLGVDVLPSIDDRSMVNDMRRTEIQRYLGYEPLLLRYLTIPFDTSISVNQYGNFVDIGYLILLFVPLIILYILRNRKTYFFTFIAIVILYCFVSVGNSYAVNSTTRDRLDTIEKLNAFTNLEKHEVPFEYTVATIYAGVYTAYESTFEPFFSKITGERDYITYPIMFFLFMSLIAIAYLYGKRRGPIITTLLVITIGYSYYWMMLSSGIIWYGYVLFILMFICMIYAIRQIKDKNELPPKLMKYSFYGLVSLWIVIGFLAKVSHIVLGSNPKGMGISIVSPSVYKYNLNLISGKDEMIDGFNAGLSKAMNRINEEPESLVYRIGTAHTIFIDNNHKRVMEDNQLAYFSGLNTVFKTKKELTTALKASDVKFLLVDLQTATIDKTPEQTLAKNFQSLMRFLNNNNGIELLGTDRVVRRETANGEQKFFRYVFGEVVSSGTYAIFEIK